MKEPSIEIPFGAKDSELCGWEYTIPDGMEATIVDNKIVVKKKESEDERIRKELISFFTERAKYTEDSTFNGLSSKEIITWLEKQGEKRSAGKVEPKFKVGDVIRLKGSAAEYTIKKVTDTTYYTNGWSCGIERCEDDYELVEQEPTEWSEEDERMCQETIDWFEKKCFPYALESENPARESIKWLKTLKDRVQPQPKHEWSEEDETALGDALWCCKQAASIAKDENDMGNVWYAERWLKSLRPQNTWRPSDLPHWKKSNLHDDNSTGFNSDYFCYKGYNINYKELFEKLPKDD